MVGLFLSICMLAISIISWEDLYLYAQTPLLSETKYYVAFLSQVVGSGFLITKSGEEKKLHVGLQLSIGDRIELGKDAFVKVNFFDSTALTLIDFTDLTIQKFQYQPHKELLQFDVFVSNGIFAFEAGKIAKKAPEHFIIRTSNTEIGVKGSSGVILQPFSRQQELGFFVFL